MRRGKQHERFSEVNIVVVLSVEPSCGFNAFLLVIESVFVPKC